jgi:hypothetical protein
MADISPSPTAPVTEDAFLADRIKAWGLFTGMTFYGAAFVVVLLILMAVFLV